MRVLLKLFPLLFLLLGAKAWADNNWFALEKENLSLQVELFMSSTCPHCLKAEAFLMDLQQKKPWIKVNKYLINEDKAALEHFHQQLGKLQVNDYAVPAIFFCNSRWVGFASVETSGKALQNGLEYCYQQIHKQGQLTESTVQVLRQEANANWLDSTMTSQPSDGLYLLSMALMDALSPCSLFIWLTLFSFLWLYRSDFVKLAFGFLFVVVLGLTHHIQLIHLPLSYELKNSLRIPAAFVGIGLLAYLFAIYFRGSTDNPKWFIPILIGLTAFILQIYQQNCFPNFGLVFEQWLQAKAYSPFKTSLYNLSYLLIYLLPMVFLVFLFTYLHRLKRLDPIRTLLICFSWCMLFFLSLIFIFYPTMLSHMGMSLIILLLALLTGILTAKRKERLGIKW